jgi:thiol-disulfide isomerase/thioredoxin
MLFSSLTSAAAPLWIYSLLASSSMSAMTEGSMLPSPTASRQLVTPAKYRLNTTELRPEVEVVVFFYAASWCAPCKLVAQALRSAYPDIITAEARLEVITYSLDFSPDARADHLRAANYPWPAIAPELIGRQAWPDQISGGTPQFQAFAIHDDYWQAITIPGDAPSIFQLALSYLNKPEQNMELNSNKIQRNTGPKTGKNKACHLTATFQ